MNLKAKVLKYVKFLLPDSLKRAVRKTKRRLYRPGGPKLTLNRLRAIIVDELQIQAGDTIIVHSSFGNLYGDFSPKDVVDLLMEIVTAEGNILMPYYPSGFSYYWIQKNIEFNVFDSKSSMGVLTEVFKGFEDVKLSPHPVKAMAVWGRDRDFLIQEHHRSIYPYDENSPYYRTILLPNSKTIGLGVEINSFIHCCEDMFLKDKLEIYADRVFKGKVRYYDRLIEVGTYLHEPKKVNDLVSGCVFLKTTKLPNYKYCEVNGSKFFSTVNKEVFEHSRPLFSNGITRNPKSLTQYKIN